MKVLTDHHVSAEFAERLADALGTVVRRTYDEGWFRLDNGALQRAALQRGYTHMVTYDKSMADDHEPQLPVLAVDDPNDDRYLEFGDGRSPAAKRQRTLTVVSAVARTLLESPPQENGYYAVLAAGLEPSKKLLRIARGHHKQQPDYEANKQRHIRDQQAKARPCR